MRRRSMFPSNFYATGLLLLLLLLQLAKGASQGEVEEHKLDLAYWETWDGAGNDEYDGGALYLDGDEDNSTDTSFSESINPSITPTPTTSTTTTATSTTPIPTTTTTPTTTIPTTTEIDESSFPCIELPRPTPKNCTQDNRECSGAHGFIYVDTRGTTTFKFIDKVSSHVLVMTPMYEPMNEHCVIKVEGTQLNTAGEKGKIFVISREKGITIQNRQVDNVCTLEYVMYKPCVENQILTAATGQLMPPRDPVGILKYRPNVKYLWSFDVMEVGSGLDLFMTKVDLDGQTHTISPSLPLDYLLVGKGADVLLGNDVMFYGQLNRVVQVSLDRPSAHVYFNTGPGHLIRESQGFLINYTSTAHTLQEAFEGHIGRSLLKKNHEDLRDINKLGPPVTSAPSTTPPPPTAPSASHETRVPLNGMPVQLGWANVSMVLNVLTEMAMLYASDKGLQLDGNITEDDVSILNVNTCDRRYCWVQCTAYNFTINAKSANGKGWAFPRERVEEMLITQKWQYLWGEMEVPCEVCLNEITLTTGSAWYWYLVTGVILVATAFLVSFGVRLVTVHQWTKRQEALRAEKLKQEEEDRRRKVSGGPSLLGGSISSRFSFPFPGYHRQSEDLHKDDEAEGSEDEEGSVSQGGVSAGEYQLFDPDLGRVNISQFGLERELLSGLHAVSGNLANQQPGNYSYVNRAFVADDDEVDGASSTDSDSEVPHFSRSHVKPAPPQGLQKQQDSRRVSLTLDTTAQIHAPDVNNDETSL